VKEQFKFDIYTRNDPSLFEHFPEEMRGIIRRSNVVALYRPQGGKATNIVTARLNYDQDLDSLISDINDFLDDAFEADKAQTSILKNRNRRQYNKPKTSITIKTVPTGGALRKDGTPKTGMGFELNVNSMYTVPIYLGSKDQAVLYAAVLLSKVLGRDLQKAVFHKSSYSQDKDVLWLKKLYEVFDYNRDWDNWYTRIARDLSKSDTTHNLNVAKTNLNSNIRGRIHKELDYDLQDKVYDLCQLEYYNSTYVVKLAPKDIFYDDAFKVLL
jgi:hypothetical protein